jgi:hypothetical protein
MIKAESGSLSSTHDAHCNFSKLGKKHLLAMAI